MAKSFSELAESVQAAIFIGVALLVGGAVFYFYDLPVYQKIPQLDKQVKELHRKNQVNQAYEQQRVEYLNQIAQMEKQLETRRLMLPDEPRTDEFVRMVHDAGVTTTINIRNFVAQAPVPHDFYIEMPFAVKLDGTYYALVSFFDRLANATRIVSATSLGLTPAAAGGPGSYSILPGETVTASCTLITYFNRPQPAQPAKK